VTWLDLGVALGAMLGVFDGDAEAAGEPLAAEPAHATTIRTRAAMAAGRAYLDMGAGTRGVAHRFRRARQAVWGLNTT
jgi:hypothetical protein